MMIQKLESNAFLDGLTFILTPVIWVMKFVLEFYMGFVQSPGLAVILLALTFTLISWPLQRIGKRYEDTIREKISKIDSELEPYKAKLKGEDLFNETEKIYQKHNYHPIKSIGLSMSFVIVLPILISAVILLSTYSMLEGQNFLFISDLSKPDGLLGSINILPFLMTGITVFDAFNRFRNDKKSRNRFLVIATVLFVLVYALPSALVIYWTTNVLVSLGLSLRRKPVV